MWINANDKLPEAFTEVLGVDIHVGCIKVVQYDYDYRRWISITGSVDVTHWQYLPELPKEA